MKTSRLAIVVLVAVLLAGAAALWRMQSHGAAPAAAARRGGQLVASIRQEPRTFNRLVARDSVGEVVAQLTQGRLVRINRSTFEVEPWLAERWEVSPDGRTYTVHLRPGLRWSDGTPFTSADVIFTLEAIADANSGAILASALSVGGDLIRATATDPATVVFTYPGPSGPGIRLLDNLWILPKHKLEPALRAGTFAKAWTTETPAADIVGTGPFVMREYQPGQRVVLERNPQYWRRGPEGETLPYLDRVVLEVVPDQNAELLRLQAGDIDLTSSELRPEDYAALKRAETQGRITLTNLGVGTDADAFWFCLKPEARKSDPKFAFVQKREFRQAISHAVDRQRFAETVFLGAAEPIWGPITPGNKLWYWPDVPKYEHDLARARELLSSIGLEDRDGNGVVEDSRGTEARFTVITQRGVSWYERALALLRDDLAGIGVAIDAAPLELNTMIQRLLSSDYEAIYMRPLMTDLDPALNKDLWLSSGSAHFWNLAQKTPATEWERRIDTLILEQSATLDPGRRRDLFNHVQRILAENVPVLYFAAPQVYIAHAARLTGATPSVLRPPVLWNADMLAVTGPPAGRATN